MTASGGRTTGGVWTALAMATVLAVATGWAAGCGGSSSRLAPSHDGGIDSATSDATTTSQTFSDAPAAMLTIQPANATLTVTSAGPATQQFTATLAGSTSPVQATWSITSGVTIGTVDGSGL